MFPPPPFLQTYTASLTMFIDTPDPTSVSGDPQVVQLSLNISSERRIEIAPRRMYMFQCIGGDRWFREGVEVTTDTTQGIHYLSPNQITKILVFTYFTNSESGRYSCRGDSSTVLIMNIVAGKHSCILSIIGEKRDHFVLNVKGCYYEPVKSTCPMPVVLIPLPLPNEIFF